MGALYSRELAITPNGQYAYLADYSGNKIWGLLLNGITGDVSPLPAAPFMTGSSPESPVVDPSGRFLYVVNGTTSENITTYAIDYATGNLSKLKTVRTRGQGGSIALTAGAAPVSYTPKYVYVANNSGNNVSAYTINPATGSLTNVTGSPFAAGSGPSVAADPAGRFLYAVNAAGGTVSAFTVDQTSGVLSAVAGSPFGGGSLMLPSSMVVDPTGTIAYVTNSAPGSTTVTSFMIDRTSGALSPRASLTSGTAPGLARMDPTGQFLYLTNPLTNNVSVFANETPVAGSPFPAGADPLGLAIDPSGQFVYVANQVSNSISAFSIDPQTGALSEIAGSPYTTTGPLALAIDGTGNFLYAANHSATNNISAYSIDPFTGALTLLPNSPFTAGNGPNDVGVDFSGKFLYVANGLSNDVSVFSINAVNGTLTQVTGSPFAAGAVPGSVATTGQIE
jgi:6-phosphogluconolactonase (cycloisomerase 2 family)